AIRANDESRCNRLVAPPDQGHLFELLQLTPNGAFGQAAIAGEALDGGERIGPIGRRVISEAHEDQLCFGLPDFLLFDCPGNGLDTHRAFELRASRSKRCNRSACAWYANARICWKCACLPSGVTEARNAWYSSSMRCLSCSS